jgi:hypothetical protein
VMAVTIGSTFHVWTWKMHHRVIGFVQIHGERWDDILVASNFPRCLLKWLTLIVVAWAIASRVIGLPIVTSKCSDPRKENLLAGSNGFRNPVTSCS